MRFEVTGKPTKLIWNNQDSWLYEIHEANTEKTLKWSVFCKQELNMDSSYLLTGAVSNSKTKKVDINNKPFWSYSFNAETITEIDNEEINF